MTKEIQISKTKISARRNWELQMGTRLIAEKAGRLMAATKRTENVEQLEAIERDLAALVGRAKRIFGGIDHRSLDIEHLPLEGGR